MQGTIRVIALVLACGALVGGAGEGKAQESGSFAADMLRRVQAHFPDAQVTPRSDPLSVTVKRDGGDDITVNFHRIYGFCQNASASDCAATRDAFIDQLPQLLEAPKITAASLRLAVRGREYVDYLRQLNLAKPTVIAESIGEDLFAVLVADSPEKVAVVPVEELQKLGMTRDQAWARAQAQTRAILPALPDGAKLKAAATVYQDQEYLASLLVDLPAWRAIADAAGPDLFATAVADNFVFVGLMPDGPELERFRQTVRDDCASQPRCVSPNLYRFRNGRWVIAR